ncbi:hypothetical protein CBL_11473 [Carabus blaptoides fortunei]
MQKKGKVSRRTMVETNFVETIGTSTEQNEITTQTDKKLSTSVPGTNCEIEVLIQELVDAITEEDTSFSSTTISSNVSLST